MEKMLSGGGVIDVTRMEAGLGSKALDETK